MFDFEGYKNEIVDSIGAIEKQQQETNTLLHEMYPPQDEIQSSEQDEIPQVPEEPKIPEETEKSEEPKEPKELKESEEEKKADDDELNQLDIQDSILSNNKEHYEVYAESTELQETFQEELIQQNEVIIESLQDIKSANIETSWALIITITLALGFHYFINQFSKW